MKFMTGYSLLDRKRNGDTLELKVALVEKNQYSINKNGKSC